MPFLLSYISGWGGILTKFITLQGGKVECGVEYEK